MTLKVMGKKLGMTQLFDKQGNRIPCTVIKIETNVVVQVKHKEVDQYSALQIGAEIIPSNKTKKLQKPLLGHFKKWKVEPRKHLFECRVEDAKQYESGQELSMTLFDKCQFVDVIGTSKGKGFQGVIKRHNFRGGPAAHGSGFHRHGGSTGMRSTPGRCLPGVKMAGHMGNVQVTVEGLEIVQMDQEKGILLVKGAIPGAKGQAVYVRKSVKKEAQQAKS